MKFAENIRLAGISKNLLDVYFGRRGRFIALNVQSPFSVLNLSFIIACVIFYYLSKYIVRSMIA